ncbi:hypothetical protein GF373_01610, partial [bacterium]|nr:hypothetical protein [bacterium]
MAMQPLFKQPLTQDRRKTRQVHVRNIPVGGDAPISVQTMVKVPTNNIDAVLRQIESTATIDPERLDDREKNILKELNAWADACALKPFHCDITRVSVPNEESADAFATIVKKSPVPVVSDIHFRSDMA